MKTRLIAATLAMLLTATMNTFAIDYDAAHIDQLGIYGLSYKDGSQSGIFLKSEVRVWGNPDWAILVGGVMGQDSVNSSDSDFWTGEFGIKTYLSEMISVAFIVDYTNLEDWDTGITAGSLVYKQRLVPANKGVSPFVQASIAYRAIDAGGDSSSTGEIVGNIGAGCQFMLTSELGLVLEGSYLHSEATASDGFEMQDGAIGSIYFIGYWN
jgi:hypothetical protein